jgi:hypothetical protein
MSCEPVDQMHQMAPWDYDPLVTSFVSNLHLVRAIFAQL